MRTGATPTGWKIEPYKDVCNEPFYFAGRTPQPRWMLRLAVWRTSIPAAVNEISACDQYP